MIINILVYGIIESIKNKKNKFPEMLKSLQYSGSVKRLTRNPEDFNPQIGLAISDEELEKLL